MKYMMSVTPTTMMSAPIAKQTNTTVNRHPTIIIIIIIIIIFFITIVDKPQQSTCTM